MTEKPKVLVCPLDWGIGHASRCVPVIRILQEEGFEVIIAADNRPLDFLRREFPDIRLFRFPGATIRYPKSDRMALKMLMLSPKILASIYHEHRVLRRIVSQTGASMVISDNRYGCWHPTIPSVIITHQLSIQAPGHLRPLRGLINHITRYLIRKFDACWIPDFELHRGLAADLSHPPSLPGNADYVGILSRFNATNPLHNGTIPELDLLVMLSGPEPQRTLLEENIISQLRNVALRVAIVRGTPETDKHQVIDGRIHLIPHLETASMQELIRSAALVICRSGYSSIMDLATLGKQAIFIPTPGQTEQEYLARHLMERKIFFSMNQKEFDLLYAIEMSKNFPGLVMKNDYKQLRECIRRVASRPGK